MGGASIENTNIDLIECAHFVRVELQRWSSWSARLRLAVRLSLQPGGGTGRCELLLFCVRISFCILVLYMSLSFSQ